MSARQADQALAMSLATRIAQHQAQQLAAGRHINAAVAAEELKIKAAPAQAAQETPAMDGRRALSAAVALAERATSHCRAEATKGRHISAAAAVAELKLADAAPAAPEEVHEIAGAKYAIAALSLDGHMVDC